MWLNGQLERVKSGGAADVEIRKLEQKRRISEIAPPVVNDEELIVCNNVLGTR